MQAQSPEKSLNVIKVIVFERGWSCCLTACFDCAFAFFFSPLVYRADLLDGACS